MAWDSRAEIKDTRVYSGMGAGLRVFLPVFEVARLELAFDEDGNPTFYFLDGNVI